MLTRRSKRHGSGRQTAFVEKTDFSLLTDLTRAVPHRAPRRARPEVSGSGRPRSQVAGALNLSTPRRLPSIGHRTGR
eukprot:5043145-Prymnesium_polylepis.2